jgi:hypothetical protein
MAIIATKTGGDFYPAPEGEQSAVCVDVIDLGMVASQFGVKHKVDVVWETPDHKNPNTGQVLTVRKRYTLSLHEKAALYKDLISWRGKPFSAEELAGFDLERLVGTSAKVVIQHTIVGNITYGNVIAVFRSLQPVAPSGKYVRRKDRPAQAATTRPATTQTVQLAVQSEPATQAPQYTLDDGKLPF